MLLISRRQLLMLGLRCWANEGKPPQSERFPSGHRPGKKESVPFTSGEFHYEPRGKKL